MHPVSKSSGTGRGLRILQVVIKNTSTLDYTIPLLWRIKRDHPDSHVSVLYCVSNRKQILRESTFYSRMLREWGIPEYDFADFLKSPLKRADGFWRKICKTCYSDRLSRPILYQLKDDGVDGMGHLWHYLAERAELCVERKLGEFMVDLERVLPYFDPDVILFDNTASKNFLGHRAFYRYFDRARRPVVLLPHAPHYIRPSDDSTPFDCSNPDLRAYCEYWMPFKLAAPWVNFPGKRSQFTYIGYPGFDTEWNSFLMSRNERNTAQSQAPGYSVKALKCLVITRGFRAKGIKRRPGDDLFFMDYDEVFEYCKLIVEACKCCHAKIQFIVKPHPATNFHMLPDMLNSAGMSNWRVSYEPFFDLVSQCDFVISMFSTSLLIPVMVGLPVILVNSDLQNYIHEWEPLERLYRGLRFFVRDPVDLSDRLRDVLDLVERRGRADNAEQSPDVKHVRSFFPDGALVQGIERLRTLLEGGAGKGSSSWHLDSQHQIGVVR